MKLFTVIMALAMILTACETHDVPSLHEQMEGRWQVSSYTEERYNWGTNSAEKEEILCGPRDFMTFSDWDRLFVNFDTAAPAIWTYKVVNHTTLQIEGKRWIITKLDDQQFHLSLNERDTSLKLTEVVSYQLKRPD